MARSDLGGGGGQKASHRARAQGDEVSASLFTHLQFALQGFSLMKEARQIKRSHATLLSLSLLISSLLFSYCLAHLSLPATAAESLSSN